MTVEPSFTERLKRNQQKEEKMFEVKGHVTRVEEAMFDKKRGVLNIEGGTHKGDKECRVTVHMPIEFIGDYKLGQELTITIK